VSPPSPSTHCFTLSLHDALPICEDCPDVTALHAMSAIVARRPVVVGRGQQGAPRGYHRDAHPGAGALDDLLGASKLERRKEFSRSEEHTSELQSRFDLVCRLLLE